MPRVICLIVLFLHWGIGYAWCSEKVHKNSIPICAAIINELTEGKIGVEQAREISLAIANAGNKHFGKVTCGEMWLYMAIVHVESGFRNNIVNDHNCRGMFQVHAPSWASKFGIGYADLLDLETNAHCGVGVFKYYLQQYKKLPATLSAYNSDHPWAAMGYAYAVLGVKNRIKKRYTQLYKLYEEQERIASKAPETVSVYTPEDRSAPK
jgi:hypothetical protein